MRGEKFYDDAYDASKTLRDTRRFYLIWKRVENTKSWMRRPYFWRNYFQTSRGTDQKRKLRQLARRAEKCIL